MELRELQQHWNLFGKRDPLYAILTLEASRARNGIWTNSLKQEGRKLRT